MITPQDYYSPQECKENLSRTPVFNVLLGIRLVIDNLLDLTEQTFKDEKDFIKQLSVIIDKKSTFDAVLKVALYQNFDTIVTALIKTESIRNSIIQTYTNAAKKHGLI